MSHRQSFLKNLWLSANTLRLCMNLWPPFVGAGIHVLRISPDYREVRVRMRLRWFNRNYVGTHFGGSLFAMTDPFYMLMLMHNLGRDYIVWDKASNIRYRAPGRHTVYAEFRLTEEQIAAVRARIEGGDSYEPTLAVDVVDHGGRIIATVEKTLFIRRAPAAAESSKLAG